MNYLTFNVKFIVGSKYRLFKLNKNPNLFSDPLGVSFAAEISFGALYFSGAESFSGELFFSGVGPVSTIGFI